MFILIKFLEHLGVTYNWEWQLLLHMTSCDHTNLWTIVAVLVAVIEWILCGCRISRSCVHHLWPLASLPHWLCFFTFFTFIHFSVTEKVTLWLENLFYWCLQSRKQYILYKQNISTYCNLARYVVVWQKPWCFMMVICFLHFKCINASLGNPTESWHHIIILKNSVRDKLG